MADRVRPPIMTSRILRTACALIVCLWATFGATVASSQTSQAQIEATRRQYLQALQRGDINTAERYEKELRALEARGSAVPEVLRCSRPAAPPWPRPPLLCPAFSPRPVGDPRLRRQRLLPSSTRRPFRRPAFLRRRSLLRVLVRDSTRHRAPPRLFHARPFPVRLREQLLPACRRSLLRRQER